MIEISLAEGDPIYLKSCSADRFRGRKIPSARLITGIHTKVEITSHDYLQSNYAISLNRFQILEAVKLQIKRKSNWLRLEVLLSGSMEIKNPTGLPFFITAGQYHLTESPVSEFQFRKKQECSLFVAFYSPEMLQTLGISGEIRSETVRPVPAVIRELIDALFVNPYDNTLRPFYYGNVLRELLFHHLSIPEITLPGALTQKQISAMQEVDRYMAEHLETPLTIQALARIAGTNTFFLKKMYEQVFGVGIFQRLVQRRMEKAKLLLEKTDKPLKDIYQLVGYETLAGFITEFRKRFNVTPNRWRKERRH